MARYRMSVICAYCGKLIRKSWANRPGVESHGICAECKREQDRKLAELKAVREERSA